MAGTRDGNRRFRQTRESGVSGNSPRGKHVRKQNVDSPVSLAGGLKPTIARISQWLNRLERRLTEQENQLSDDFLIEVQKGNIPGHSIVHKFGRNDAVGTSWEFLWNISTPITYLTTPEALRIKAGGDATDTAAGAGAREVTVVGIDSNLVEVSETIATAGASASSATTATFWRPYRCFVSATGTYGASSAGVITIENAAGGTDLLQMADGFAQSQFGGFSIPTGVTGYLLSIFISVDGNKPADVRMCTRENFNTTSAPFPAVRSKLYLDAVSGGLSFSPKSPTVLPALTDVWFEAESASGTTEVSVDFEVLLVED